MKLDRQSTLQQTDETSMRPTFTSAHEIGPTDVATRGLIVILLGILPR
jgi:hypothetical protein